MTASVGAKESGSEPLTTNLMFTLVRQDIQRCIQSESPDGKPGLFRTVRIFLDEPGLQAILVYRFGSWVNRTFRFPLIRYPLKFIYYILNKLCIICWGIQIDDGARIGGGLYIGHFGGILIGPARMGCDCNVGPHVIIGRRAGADSGIPTIGDRAWIGAGSVIFGGITVGDGVTIGPLTVVARNLPPKVLVMGNPMRLLRKSYDNSAEIYGESRKKDW